MEAKFQPFVDALLGPINSESPGYSGPMKHNLPGYLQIILIFINLLDIHECPGYGHNRQKRRSVTDPWLFSTLLILK